VAHSLLLKLYFSPGKEVEEKVNKMQRKFMLNEQLKIIKKELGIEKDDKDAVQEKFRDRIKDKTLPDNIAEVLVIVTGWFWFIQPLGS